MKTSVQARERNRAVRSHMKSSIKALRGCQTRAEAETMIKDVMSVIDKAAHHNVIHKNKAARVKSRLVAMVGRLSS